MIFKRCLIQVAIGLCAALTTLAQSGMPFLLISPSAEMNGRGETSVAVTGDDPVGAIASPAHVGFSALGNYFSGGINYADWLPMFRQSDLRFTTYGFMGGVNLNRSFGLETNIGIGFSYSRIYLNLGDFAVTGDDPTVIATYHAYESVHQYTIGAAIDSWVRCAAGFTFKRAFSNLAPFDIQGQGRAGIANVSAYDVGLLLEVPVIEIVSRWTQRPLSFGHSWKPLCDITVGIANNNLGDNTISYDGDASSDPLPRYARAGIGLRVGILAEMMGVTFKPLTFTWTAEANDMLVTLNPLPRDSAGNPIGTRSWTIRSGLGGIKPFRDLVLGRFNEETIMKRGWEVNVGDVLILRWGRFEEDYRRGGRQFKTTGFGLRMKGLLQFLSVVSDESVMQGIVGFILRHVDLRYDRNRIETMDPMHPLNTTEFVSGRIVISN